MIDGFKVGNEYRVNPYSHKNGGCTVIVLKTNNQLLEYDKIKYPNAYIKNVLKNKDVVKAWIK